MPSLIVEKILQEENNEDGLVFLHKACGCKVNFLDVVIKDSEKESVFSVFLLLWDIVLDVYVAMCVENRRHTNYMVLEVGV